MRFANAWFIGWKDFLYSIRGRETLIWIVIMPIVFFYFIGTVTGGGGLTGLAGEGKPQAMALYAGGTPGFLLDELVGRLDENRFSVTRVGTEAELAAHPLRVRVPNDFSARVLAGERAALQIHRRKATLSDRLDDIRIGRAAYTVLADVVAAAEEGREPTPASFARLREKPHTLTLEVRPAGKRRKIPTGFELAIPGMLVMFTMIVLLTSGTTSLVIERREGLLRRLASAPISRGELVLGKWIGRMGLAVVQVGIALLFGTVIFGMDWGPNLGMVLLVLLAWSAFCASFGLLLGCLARTEAQAIGLGVLTACGLAALGGCWWPIEVTGAGMQRVAELIPTGWTMDAMHKLINYRMAPGSVVGNVVLILVGTVMLGWIAALRFRYQDA